MLEVQKVPFVQVKGIKKFPPTLRESQLFRGSIDRSAAPPGLCELNGTWLGNKTTLQDWAGRSNREK
jgi:hypothetical protein